MNIAPPISPVPEGVEVLSVEALTSQVKTSLEEKFKSIWVEGEISNLSRPNSGHIYLSLKDQKATIGSVIYRGIALRMRFDPRDGMEVVARGRMSVYAPQGKYQFVIEELHPKGIGSLELALRQLREKLFLKGYFDPARKKQLPAYPRRIALVTSPTGAAVRDMLEILAKRWPLGKVLVCPVRVQGEGAAEEISAMINLLNRLQPKLRLDAMIVGRGGGSLEDLWAFNEEIVADAIFQSRVPLISAVGHEIDVTVADDVADYRALTPSQGATALTPDRNDVLLGLRDMRRRLDDAILNRIRFLKQRLDSMATRRAFRMPLERIRDQERRLDEISSRMKRAMKVRLVRSQDRIAAIAGRLQTLSPLNVLSRGYSLTRLESSPQLLRDAGEVQVGDRLVTRLETGTIISRVEEITTPPNAGEPK